MSRAVTEETRRQANLRLLQRTCSSEITDISVSATHVVLYEYRGAAWHKSGIEGSLFVVQRKAKHNNTLSHQLIVLNRHSNDNLEVVLTAHFQVQHQNPYLIFKQQRATTSTNQQQQQHEAEAPRVRGIWFHSDEERGNVFAVLQRTLQTIQQHEAALAAVQAEEEAAATAAASVEAAAAAVVPPSSVAAADASAALATLFASPSMSVEQQAASSGSSRTTSAPAAASAPATLPQTGKAMQQPDTIAATGTSGSTSSAPASAGSSANSSNASAVLPPEGVALDKKSLQLALLSLIQDDRFLDLLHSQYLRVVHARANKSKQGGSSNNNGNN